MIKTDFLVIGSGIAGLSYALKIATHLPNKKVLIITKSNKDETNTKYAQGGLAAVQNFQNDSYNKHIEDTIKTGDGLCNKKIVEMVIKEGPLRLKELIDWGVKFDKTPLGNYDLGMEGGHSANRIVHHKDITGYAIEKSLLKKIKQLGNIHFLPYHFSIDIITQQHLKKKINGYSKKNTCIGAYILDIRTQKISTVFSNIIVLATGGIGQVYLNTTNPKIATGDGIAMAYRAGCKIENMEFIQFHPTALYYPKESPSFLITEALRGQGALLRNIAGKLFMKKYHNKKELAPRDIVSRAIDNEMKCSCSKHVYLDCRHLDSKMLFRKFPNIYNKCKSLGVDMRKNLIPVVPAAHYICGGIKTNQYGKTSIKNLYAIGECASTGLHGANRLASNSLLEAIVFAHRGFADSVNNIEYKNNKTKIPSLNYMGNVNKNEMVLITNKINELKTVMSNYDGIVRSNERLKIALLKIKVLEKEIEKLYKHSILSFPLFELRNLTTIAHLIVKSALKRRENVGLHYNIDLLK